MSEARETREELEARIAAYIDGELSPAEAARLEVFLANTDPQLAEQVIGMLADKHRLKALPKVKAPVDLAARIMEQVERASLLHDSEHFSSPKRPWYQTRGAIAAGIVLVIGGFSYFLLTSVLTGESPWRNPLAKNEMSGVPAVVTPPAAAPSPAPQAPPPTVAPGASATATPSEGAIAVAPAAPAAVSPPLTESKADTVTKAGDDEGGRVAAKSAPRSMAKGGAADTVTNTPSSLGGGFNRAFVNTQQETAEQSVQATIERDRKFLASGDVNEAQKLGYTETATPELAVSKALDKVELRQEKVVADVPVVLAFASRGPEDVSKLQARLTELIATDPDAGKKQTTLQSALKDGLGSTSNLSNSVSVQPNGTTYRLYHDDQKAFDKDQVTDGAAANNENMAPVQAQDMQQPAMAQQAPAPAAIPPYRAVLRADQVQKLAGEFDLRAVSRGQAAYAVSRGLQNATADEPATQAAASGVAGPAVTGQTVGTEKEKSSAGWVDCIITIEPAK